MQQLAGGLVAAGVGLDGHQVGLGRQVEFVGGQGQLCHFRVAVKDGGRGLCEGGVGEVVGHVGGGSVGTDPELPQVVFEVGGEGRRDLEAVDPAGVLLPQLRIGGVYRQGRGARVREGHGHAVTGQQHRDVEPLDQPDQSVTEQSPAVIGFRTAHHEVRHSFGVACQVQVQHWFLERGPVVAVEDHGGTAGTVVVDEVHVERPEQLRFGVLQEGLDQRRTDASRVDETVEEVEQRRSRPRDGAPQVFVDGKPVGHTPSLTAEPPFCAPAGTG